MLNPREGVDRAQRLVSDQLLRFRSVADAGHLATSSLAPRTPWIGEAAAHRHLEPTSLPNAVLERGRAVSDGHVTVFGSFHVDVSHDIDWHRDPITDIRAPSGWFTSVPYLDATKVGDHKGVWELNRLQWLLDLARLHRQQPTSHSASTIARVLDGWMVSNPPFMGINWTSALEVALRAIMWTAILNQTESSERPLDPRLLRRCVDTMAAHMQYILGHLSTWFAPNTHLTGEALGLLVLGTAWPGLHGAPAAAERGWRILSEQLPLQLRDDGSYFEQSTWYLGYSLDFYAEAAVWAKLRGWEFPVAKLDRLTRANRLLAALRRPDGSLIPIGDDDGGSLWNDARSTTPQMAGTQRRVEAITGNSVPREADWAVDRFNDAGMCCIRDRDGACGALDQLVVDSGPQGAFGHGHDDPLTFDLSIAGRSLVRDPGTGSYAQPEIRRALRSRQVHASLDHQGLQRPEPRGPFGWRSRVDGRLLSTGHTDSLSWCVTRVGAAPHTEHCRVIIRLRHSCWLVVDMLERSGNAAGAVHRLPLAEGLRPVTSSERCNEIEVLDGFTQGELVGRILMDPSCELRLLSGVQSACYGTWGPSVIVEGVNRHPEVSAWCTVLAGPSACVGLLTRQAGETWTVATAHGSVDLAIVRISNGVASHLLIERRAVTLSIDLLDVSRGPAITNAIPSARR